MDRPAPKYQRSVPGMIGAMIVVVAVVLGWTVFRAVTSDQNATPVQTVDWLPLVTQGRTEGAIQLMAPSALPAGWRATSAQYRGGQNASWHLGMLTDHGKYVGLEESLGSTRSLAEQYVDAAAARGKDIRIGGRAWQTWTDAGGDYAVARTDRASGMVLSSYLVVGSAPPAQIRDFAATLAGGPVKRAG